VGLGSLSHIFSRDDPFGLLVPAQLATLRSHPLVRRRPL
jgi:hypothetical protein